MSDTTGQSHAPALSFDGLRVTYRHREHPALDGIDLSLPPGTLTGIVGANGAGKSTLMSCVNRVIPTVVRAGVEGSIALFGRPIAGRRVAELAATVGMVFQDFETQLFSSDLRRETAFMMENLGIDRAEMRRRCEEQLRRMGLWEHRFAEPSSLSGGQKQRLALASVLAAQTPILILDEPTTDLDPASAEQVLGDLSQARRLGQTIILVTHELDHLAAADRLGVLANGRLTHAGEARALLDDVAVLRDAGLEPPQLAELFWRLGLPERPGDVDSAEALLRSLGFRVAGDTLTPIDPSREIVASVQDVSFSYRAGTNVIDRARFDLRAGAITALLGRNGSGKTTLVKLLAGILPAGSGRVEVGGADIAAVSAARRPGLVGLVFQNPDHQIFSPTVAEEVAFGPQRQGLSPDEVTTRVREALVSVGLAADADRDPFAMTKGERKRVALASVLACRPSILIMDEPTTGLDAREQDAMLATVGGLARAGHAVLLVTHHMSVVARWADRALILHEGRLIADEPVPRLFSNAEVLSAAGLAAPRATALGARFALAVRTPAELAAHFGER